jgi:asparagine synthase (glutamine-hydrolysing)
MCGLVVTASFEGAPADVRLLKRASDVLLHRGPDDFGIATFGGIGFAFRRLAILDLSPGGHQPMELQEAGLAVVFNGEIYNYLELKHELQQLGHRFKTASDTEVLLHAYLEWGSACVHHLNGMWAFVIYDERRQRLFASRDRFGVKPLYRWSDGKRLVLASEIKAIVATGWYQPSVNWSTTASFLVDGYLDQDRATFFSGIEQLPAGSTLEVTLDGLMREQRFWSVSQVSEDRPDDPVGTFRELFEDSVRLRMRSDVPVGVCLSGGIDSNAIISTMSKLRGQHVGYPLQAFSYIPAEFSEADYINESVLQTNAILNTLDVTPRELWDVLPKALWHYDEPAHSPTALIGFQLMRLAKSRGTTVVLNGQGADEVNAGYHVYFRTYWAELLHRGKWRHALSEMSDYARASGGPVRRIVTGAAAHWLRSELRQLRGTAGVPASRSGHKARAGSGWYARELQDTIAPAQTLSGISLTAALVRSVERRPLPLYLRIEDRNSMAHSVEARLPFLDYRLVTMSFRLPSEWKLRGRWNKYVVREAMKGVVAERVRSRFDKMGFPTPSRQWLAGPWYEPMRDVISMKRLRESGICDVRLVREDLDRHRAGAVDVSGSMFHLAEFSVWLDSILAAPAVLDPPRVTHVTSPAAVRKVGVMPRG